MSASRAALYARFSSDLQRDASIEDQFRNCARMAQTSGLVEVARFEDRAISGGTADRPGYQGMLTAARSGSFDIIITEDISRLWRNRSEFGQRSAELEDLGVHLLTCVGDDTRRDGWGLVVGLKAVLAEHARKEISYRTRRALEGLALAGQSTGGRFFGQDPAEVPVLRRVFALRAGGMSLRGIAAALNAERLVAPHGGRWRHSTVAAMLANTRYAGTVFWGKTESKGGAVDSRQRRRAMRPSGPLVVRQEAALIEKNLWTAAQVRGTLRAETV